MPAVAQQVPKTPAEVARPGGTIAGAQKLAFVKVADGFNDPTGVTVANDGTGRIFVVERWDGSGSCRRTASSRASLSST